MTLKSYRRARGITFVNPPTFTREGIQIVERVYKMALQKVAKVTSKGQVVIPLRYRRHITLGRALECFLSNTVAS
jgi:hypothetical protein